MSFHYRCGLALMVLLIVGLPCYGARAEAELRLGHGVDSNPLQLADGGPGGNYIEAELDGGASFRPHAKVRLYLNGQVTHRSHESNTEHADSTRGRASGAAAFVPWKRGPRYVALIAGLRQRLYDSTYIDPRTGAIFEYAESDGNGGTITAELPERLDYDATEAFARLRWAANRRLRLSLDLRKEWRDYAAGDSSLQTLESLDYDAFTIEPGVRFVLSELVTLNLSAYQTDRNYDDQFALDENGFEVSGVMREYTYRGYRIAFRVERDERIDLRFGFHGNQRSDHYADYYDSDSITAYVWGSRKIGERNRLEAYASARQLDYDNALVSSVPGGELRAGEVLTARLQFERRVYGPLAWFVEGGAQRSDNNDPAFEYDRNWGSTGLAIQFARAR